MATNIAYVNSGELTQLATSMKIKSANILDTFNDDCVTAIKASDTALQISGYSSEKMVASLSKIFDNLNTRIGNLANFIIKNVSDEYYYASKSIASSFDREMGAKLAKLLGLIQTPLAVVGAVTGNQTGGSGSGSGSGGKGGSSSEESSSGGSSSGGSGSSESGNAQDDVIKGGADRIISSETDENGVTVTVKETADGHRYTVRSYSVEQKEGATGNGPDKKITEEIIYYSNSVDKTSKELQTAKDQHTQALIDFNNGKINEQQLFDAQTAVASAQKKYDTAIENFVTPETLSLAQTQLQTAKDQHTQALIDFNNGKINEQELFNRQTNLATAQEKYDAISQKVVTTQDVSLARTNLQTAKDQHTQALIDFNSGKINEQELFNRQTNLATAQSNFDTISDAYDNMPKKVTQAIYQTESGHTYKVTSGNDRNATLAAVASKPSTSISASTLQASRNSSNSNNTPTASTVQASVKSSSSSSSSSSKVSAVEAAISRSSINSSGYSSSRSKR